MNDALEIQEAATQLGCSLRHLQRMCKSGALKGARKEGGSWLIPVTADARLRGIQSSDDLSKQVDLGDVSETKRQEALRRLGTIEEFNKFSSRAVRSGCLRTQAMEEFAAHTGISLASLKRWLARYRLEGLKGLIDGRGGGQFASETITPEAFEYFKSLWLTQQQLSVKLCWSMVDHLNKTESRDWQLPGLRAMYNVIDRDIPLAVQVLHREGLTAYEARCAPYIQVDPDSVEPGAVWIGDHSPFNCWIRHRERWVRPWITVWEDMRSRLLVGWKISAGPNQTTILIAMRRAIEKYGPPESVKIDNGRDYDSEMWTGTTKVRRRFLKKGYVDEQMVAGIYAMMGVGVSFAIPFNAKAKSVERVFDTIDCQFTKTTKTFCGKDAPRRPEQLNDYLQTDRAVREAYDLEGFAQLFARYVKEVYNVSAHRGKGMEGRSPQQVFHERTSRRVIREGVLDLLMRVWSGRLKAGKNGVRFRGLLYGQYDTELMRHQGKEVRVSYDPDDLSSVHVYDATTLKLITVAEQNRLAQYGRNVKDEHLRRAMQERQRAMRTVKSYRQASLTANMNLTDLAIAAQRPDPKPQEKAASWPPRLKPVRTPMDDQMAAHVRRKLTRQLKRAAGTERTEELDIDLSLLSPDKQAPAEDLELYSHE